MLGPILNPLNETSSGKEVVVYTGSRNLSANRESDIDLLSSSWSDEITPYIEAFPRLSQERPKVPVTHNLYEEIFKDSIVNSLVENHNKGLVTFPREPIFYVTKALSKFMQSHPDVVVPNKSEGLTQYFNSVADMTVREIFPKIVDCNIIENIQMA